MNLLLTVACSVLVVALVRVNLRYQKLRKEVGSVARTIREDKP